MGKTNLVFGMNGMLMALVLDLLLYPIFVSNLLKEFVSLSLVKHTNENQKILLLCSLPSNMEHAELGTNPIHR